MKNQTRKLQRGPSLKDRVAAADRRASEVRIQAVKARGVADRLAVDKDTVGLGSLGSIAIGAATGHAGLVFGPIVKEVKKGWDAIQADERATALEATASEHEQAAEELRKEARRSRMKRIGAAAAAGTALGITVIGKAASSKGH
ncbi:hypothetical protein [Actinomadura gamaensis]|uniref:DUF3618 domain-containing protein n=1 Tax=Actinomadura gamaensis TaxID=1763541 RepID=A0ABV9TSN5_9ACTN